MHTVKIPLSPATLAVLNNSRMSEEVDCLFADNLQGDVQTWCIQDQALVVITSDTSTPEQTAGLVADLDNLAKYSHTF